MFWRKIETTQGRMALLESAGAGLPVVLIHGNSSCKEVFQQQFESDFAATHRLIALDLLGHGDSDDASDPSEAYVVPGHATTIIEALKTLDIHRAAIFGWSLGGHIAIEMLGQGYDAAGLMIVGTPPVSHGMFGLIRGFQTQFDLLLAARAILRPHEVERFATVCVGKANAPRFYDTIVRTDPRARPTVARGMIRSAGVDQRLVAEQSRVPIAVVNGAHEPFARLDYVAGLAYGNLWDRRCHVIAEAGHAPFIETPELFNPIFHRFVNEVSASGAGRTGLRSHRVA